LIFAVLALAWCVSSPAGVLLTKKSEVEIGTLTENETGVALQVQGGAVQFRKEVLLWYSVQPDIDTLLKAGKKAAADGNASAAKLLFNLSITRETATADQARAEIENLSKAPPPAPPAPVAVVKPPPVVEKPAGEPVAKTAIEGSKDGTGPWTLNREEQMANYGLAAGLALVALFALWQITSKEPEETSRTGGGRGGGLK
jgi:hypothetical protein